MNDTHPAIAGPELVRLLVDERGMAFDAAFEIARACLHCTNHTLLPKALERWPVDWARDKTGSSSIRTRRSTSRSSVFTSTSASS